MSVPITSDLAGYREFWIIAIRWIIVGIIASLMPVYVLLWLIWRK